MLYKANCHLKYGVGEISADNNIDSQSLVWFSNQQYKVGAGKLINQ